jgi:RimJ/RimL family protein N-acetyltransferase
MGIVVWSWLITPGPRGCLQIGILLAPEHRGRGVGTEAQRLLVDYLFSTTAANRLEATTEVDNVAEQRALEKAGFIQEGLLRERGFVRGAWRDGYIYSRLRSD